MMGVWRSSDTREICYVIFKANGLFLTTVRIVHLKSWRIYSVIGRPLCQSWSWSCGPEAATGTKTAIMRKCMLFSFSRHSSNMAARSLLTYTQNNNSCSARKSRGAGCDLLYIFHHKGSWQLGERSWFNLTALDWLPALLSATLTEKRVCF